MTEFPPPCRGEYLLLNRHDNEPKARNNAPTPKISVIARAVRPAAIQKTCAGKRRMDCHGASLLVMTGERRSNRPSGGSSVIARSGTTKQSGKPHGLLRRAARAMVARSNRRDTPENDRNPDTSDWSIDGLSSATWHRLSSMTAQVSSLRGAQRRGNPPRFRRDAVFLGTRASGPPGLPYAEPPSSVGAGLKPAPTAAHGRTHGTNQRAGCPRTQNICPLYRYIILI
jgi:hypothetical protein